MKPLNTPGIPSEGQLINAGGDVAGFFDDTSAFTRSFFVGACQCLKDLGTLGGDISQAFSLNESGWVTGFALTKAAESHGFVFDGSSMRDLRTLGGSVSEGTAINASGQVVGFASTAKGD